MGELMNLRLVVRVAVAFLALALFAVPASATAKKTKGKIVVKVKADGVVPVDGKVKITVEGQGTTTVKLVDGKAVVKLDVFNSAGKRDVTVKYLGNALVEDGKAKDVINVKP